MDHFERVVDAVGEELKSLDDAPEPMVGIYLPASPEGAGLLPSRWVPIESVEEPPTRLVLLVHGLDEPGDIWSDLAPEIVKADYHVGRFEYPNDQPVLDSGALLVASLRSARAAGVEEVSLIAHSMGGLVAFDALTREDGYGGIVEGTDELPRVVRLITVGTPWAGSPWARLRVVAEVREQAQRWFMEESWDIRPLLAYRTDGLGGAGEDLSEGSTLVKMLRARPMPARLPLTVIAGRMIPAEDLDLSWVKESKLLQGVLRRKQLSELLTELTVAGNTLGDGIVPLDSALARAGDDKVVLEANHRGLVRRTLIDRGSADALPPAIAVILARLKADQSPTEPLTANPWPE
jgi:pimeloyl-ACP methyl ester carboxylesterase